MKTIYLIAIVITLVSCKKEKIIDGSIVVSTSLKVSFLNSAKEDLLKSLGDESVSKMRLYYLVNGKRRLYHEPNLTAPYGITLIKPKEQGSLHQLNLGLYDDKTMGENVQSTTILVWGDGTEDIIIGTFFNDSNNYILTKFQYNHIKGGMKEIEGFVYTRD